MYCKEKQSKPRKTHRTQPSFSSSLLDEICRSIDGATPPPNTETRTEEEYSARFPRPCLADTKKTHKSKKSDNTIFPDNDPSDADLFASVKRPKPVRTTKNSDTILFDDYHNYETNNPLNDQIKSKSKMLKIYAQLKKLKQPISPGAKLTSLLNSIFTKKSKRNAESKAGNVDCGRRNSYDVQKIDRCGRPPLPPNAVRIGDQRRLDLSFFGKIENGDEDEDEEDGASESSSDLFELDHLSFYGRSDRFCEELPVYGTTYFDKNRGLIR